MRLLSVYSQLRFRLWIPIWGKILAETESQIWDYFYTQIWVCFVNTAPEKHSTKEIWLNIIFILNKFYKHCQTFPSQYFPNVCMSISTRRLFNNSTIMWFYRATQSRNRPPSVVIGLTDSNVCERPITMDECLFLYRDCIVLKLISLDSPGHIFPEIYGLYGSL